MKTTINILLITGLIICALGCKDKQTIQKDLIFDKAIVFYNSNIPPWGILKVTNISAEDFLNNNVGLTQIALTDMDSLRYIKECIIHAKLDTLKNNDYVDTSIAMLLYSGKNVDTLTSNAYPQHLLQYNNTTFRDSLLVYYIIDAIRQRDSIWNNAAQDFYYLGQYQHLPKSAWGGVSVNKD